MPLSVSPKTESVPDTPVSVPVVSLQSTLCLYGANDIWAVVGECDGMLQMDSLITGEKFEVDRAILKECESGKISWTIDPLTAESLAVAIGAFTR